MKTLATAVALSLAVLGEACLLPGEAEGRAPLLRGRQSGNTGIPVGNGDRFEGGSVVPQGAGSREAGFNFSSILNVDEIHSAVKALVDEYDLEYFEAPEKTFEGNPIFGAKVGGAKNCSASYHSYINGNIHARERGSSDNVVYFISDLLYADKHGEGLQYGGRTYTNGDVRRALDTGIVFTPLSNPDGVAWDQQTDSCWRKNRNTTSATEGDDDSIGIDLNRNFDFLFEYLEKFHPEVGPTLASEDPSAETFHGTEAFSEAEARAVKWVMDGHENLRWFLDVHSYTGVLLFGWGADENQIRDPYMNFQNESYDAVRGLMPDDPESGAVYGEYIPSEDWSEKVYAGIRSATAMDASTGRHYEVMSAASLYPTSGASDDYAYSRHFVDPSLSKIHGYCLEFGFGNEDASCPFYPSPEQYHQHLLETGAGFMEWLLAASEIGLGEASSC